jgi:probable rRNA maturation factor
MMPILLNRQRKIKVPLSSLLTFASGLCRHLKLPEGEFAIVLVSDRRMRRWNHDFRHIDKATDVLSFPSGLAEETRADFEIPYWGDMIISVETARCQARKHGHSLVKEMKILILHGALHLLGYDHERDGGQMRRKELRLRRELISL